jgi:hypothetical protein
MARKEDRWVTGKEATAILNRNSGREDIPDSYIRSLARAGKVGMKQARAGNSVDGRTNLYRANDLEGYRVERRDQGKGRSRKTPVHKTEEPQTDRISALCP